MWWGGEGSNRQARSALCLKVPLAFFNPWDPSSRVNDFHDAPHNAPALVAMRASLALPGTHGNAGQANYATAKAGVVGLTKSVAKVRGLPMSVCSWPGRVGACTQRGGQWPMGTTYDLVVALPTPAVTQAPAAQYTCSFLLAHYLSSNLYQPLLTHPHKQSC